MPLIVKGTTAIPLVKSPRIAVIYPGTRHLPQSLFTHASLCIAYNTFIAYIAFTSDIRLAINLEDSYDHSLTSRAASYCY